MSATYSAAVAEVEGDARHWDHSPSYNRALPHVLARIA